MIFPIIPPWFYVAGALAVASVFGVEELRIANLHTDLAQEKTQRADETAERTQLVLDHEISIGKITRQHAADQQTKDDNYAAKITDLKSAAVRGAADARGLRIKLATFTASARQPGETDAAASERAQHRLGLVGALLEESIELEAESREIIERRDAEVARLLDQVLLDRAAIETKN